MDLTIQQPDKKYKRWKTVSMVLQWSAIILLWLSLLLLSWRMLPFPVVWKTTDWSLGRFEIKATTIDENGDPWFLSEKSYDNYQLRHVTKEGTVSWDLPFITLEDAMFLGIVKGKDGNPWLILGKQIAHWNGSQWNFIPMPLEANILSLSCPNMVIKDSVVWGIDYEAKPPRIIQLDLNQEPVQAQEILLPNDLDPEQYGFQCIISTGDAILAVLASDSQTSIYQFHNLKWEKITSFQKEQVSYWGVHDITVDSKDQIWVVLRAPLHEKPVGKYDPTTNKWIWLNIEQQSDLQDRTFEYGHLAVDERGRIWLSATQYRKEGDIIFSGNFEANTVGVFVEENNTLQEIRHYTSKNSNLETSQSAKILIGSDNKIWTWNQQLVWMDRNQKELPNPLPEWLVTLTRYEAVLTIDVISLILMIASAVIRIRQRRRNPKIKGNTNG
jgi:hypothetical protein